MCSSVCNAGELLSWGTGPMGVTGRCDQEAARHPLPLCVRAANLPIASVSTGPLHTLTLTSQPRGRVMGYGSAMLGQLGNTQEVGQTGAGCMLCGLSQAEGFSRVLADAQ
jgi:hypothetical protein